MHRSLLPRYVDTIRRLDPTSIRTADDIPSEFLLHREGMLSAHYTPFDHVNCRARLVIVGITPGLTQWINAMQAAKHGLIRGDDIDTLLLETKRIGAFSGKMRSALVALMDSVGIPGWLDIPGSAALFGTRSDLLHSTSLLRHAVFVEAKNYSGQPSAVRTPMLQRMMLEYFAKDISLLPQAQYLPLGPKVAEGLSWLAAQGILDKRRILPPIPHPAGPNAERITYFLGKKPRATLSVKTDSDKLDEAKRQLLLRIAALRSPYVIDVPRSAPPGKSSAA